jgi:hypothetical protein
VRGHPLQHSGGRRSQHSHASEQCRASAKGCSRGRDPSGTRCEVREHASEWAGGVRVSLASKREHRVSQIHHEGARAERGVLHVHHRIARREVHVGRRELDGRVPIYIGMHRCSCGRHSHPCGTHDRLCGPCARSCGPRARSSGVHLHSCGPRACPSGGGARSPHRPLAVVEHGFCFVRHRLAFADRQSRSRGTSSPSVGCRAASAGGRPHSVGVLSHSPVTDGRSVGRGSRSLDTSSGSRDCRHRRGSGGAGSGGT